MTESHAVTAQPIDPGLARAINSYVPTDSYSGRPFIDADEMRDDPLPHRYIHGGFEHTDNRRAEEHTCVLQSLMSNSYAVFCLKNKKKNTITIHNTNYKRNTLPHYTPKY